MGKETTKQRINRLLNSDKEGMSEETKRAALADFTHVAEEYFEREGEIGFEVHRSKNHMDVNITFRAVRVKNFMTLK